MRLITTILLLLCFNANATVYYVSNSGSDAANGLTTGTAWQTLSKVNGFTFAANDSILLKSGDSWNEQLLCPRSNLYFGSYSIGLKPLITGFQTLSGFVNTSGNIWRATATLSVKKQNTVIVNGAIRAKGRYPNSSYLSSYSIATTQLRIAGTGLTGTPNYTNAELVTKGHRWIIDVNTISQQSADTLNVSTPFTYLLSSYSYFIQNTPSVLDIQNEWCIDSATKLLSVYSTVSPSVQYSVIDTLVYLNGNDNITFNGIAFEGGNLCGIEFDFSDNVSILNCTFKNIGFTAIQGYPSNSTIVQNDSLQNILNNGMRIFGTGGVTISNNYLENIGYLEGMGGNGNGMYMGFFGGYPSVSGLSITNNTFKKIGFNPIYFQGANSYIYRNVIDSFGLTKDDGGGIYCFDNNTSGSVIRSNIIKNGIGFSWISCGIYLDNRTSGVTVDSNTIFNTQVSGIHLNDNSTGANYVRNNTISTVRRNGLNLYGGIYMYGGNQFNIKRNVIFIADTLVPVIGGSASGNIDSNYYLRPLKPAAMLNYAIGGQFNYSLSQWVSATGLDVNSFAMPVGTISTSGVLHINQTSNTVAISIPGRWISAKGDVYTNSLPLLPFQSQILFYSSTQPSVTISASFKIGSLNFQ